MFPAIRSNRDNLGIISPAFCTQPSVMVLNEESWYNV